MKEVSRAIITTDEGKVLLGKREHGIGAGQYALVGGKPDAGESAEAAVVREVREEIGVDFHPVFYQERVDNISDPEVFWKVTYFTGEIEGEVTPDPREILDVISMTEEELATIEIAFDHREVLEEYFQKRT